ncbi:DUF3139 domain-containing protein [Rossellomorea marisflavi]|uniref:DUF3139 domain-containing protein n=1 Tax=Rossellomorea marisflavi TaxID=189381 RepID=UPI003FA0A785
MKKTKRHAFLKGLGLAVLILLVLIPMGFMVMLHMDNPYQKYIVEKYVPIHLEKVGESPSGMIESMYVQPNYIINRDYYQGHYYVVYKDEPEYGYYYGVQKRGKKVVQFCEKETIVSEFETGDMVTTKTKHSEKMCDGYFKNR